MDILANNCEVVINLIWKINECSFHKYRHEYSWCEHPEFGKLRHSLWTWLLRRLFWSSIGTKGMFLIQRPLCVVGLLLSIRSIDDFMINLKAFMGSVATAFNKGRN